MMLNKGKDSLKPLGTSIFHRLEQVASNPSIGPYISESSFINHLSGSIYGEEGFTNIHKSFIPTSGNSKIFQGIGEQLKEEQIVIQN